MDCPFFFFSGVSGFKRNRYPFWAPVWLPCVYFFIFFPPLPAGSPPLFFGELWVEPSPPRILFFENRGSPLCKKSMSPSTPFFPPLPDLKPSPPSLMNRARGPRNFSLMGDSPPPLFPLFSGVILSLPRSGEEILFFSFSSFLAPPARRCRPLFSPPHNFMSYFSSGSTKALSFLSLYGSSRHEVLSFFSFEGRFLILERLFESLFFRAAGLRVF